MLNSNHPDDERLSALASRDTDATADTSLTAHLSTCDRCTDLVNELGALRASLADLPDLEPSRPLRLLPAADEAPAGADRIGGWARRFFAPVLTAGAALAMVGLVGTAAPALDGMASGGAQSGAAPSTMAMEAPEAEASAASEDTSERTAAGEPDALVGASDSAAASDGADGETMNTFGGGADAGELEDEDRGALTQLPIERSPWPMVLFTGVALMVAAALLRWILVPRAG
jgi:anti-sigma factor RsiW